MIAKMATMDVAAIALVDRRLNVMVGTLALGWNANAQRVSVNAEKKSVRYSIVFSGRVPKTDRRLSADL